VARAIGLVGVSVIATVALAWLVGDRVVNADYYALKSRLQEVPELSAINSREGDGLVPHRVIDSAEFIVGGDPSRRIAIDPNDGIFDGSGDLDVWQLGPHYFVNTMPLNRRSPSAPSLPLPRQVSTLRDLIDHYDQIAAAVDTWPHDEDDSVTVTDADGTRHEFEIWLRP
jgi:hypothetical protein